MEALETALGYWEDALAAYTAGVTGGVALTSQDEAEFTALLQRVIDDAYSLQDQCEHLFLHQVSRRLCNYYYSAFNCYNRNPV